MPSKFFTLFLGETNNQLQEDKQISEALTLHDGGIGVPQRTIESKQLDGENHKE